MGWSFASALLAGWANSGAGALGVQIRHHCDFNPPAGAALNLLLVALEHVKGAASDDADAQKAYLNGFHIAGQTKVRKNKIPGAQATCAAAWCWR
jgi:hypothetical protein